MNSPAITRLRARWHDVRSRLQTWVEHHPGQSWVIAIVLVAAITGLEISYWPKNDYPGAMWHASPRGEDIERGQDRAAEAGPRELWGYWIGPMLHGHGYYRPLTSWLFVGEYRLFGRDDRRWAVVNLALHVAVVLTLMWAVSVWTGGALLRRLTVGVSAALLLAAPGVADRSVQKWVCGWWPCQSEILSLLLGLVVMGAAAMYADTPEKRWGVLACIAFFLAVCFKEMGYVAGLGACLLLVRRPKARGLLLTLAGLGVLFFAYRWLAISRETRVITGPGLGRLLEVGRGNSTFLWEQFASMAPHLLFLAAAGATAWGLRSRLGTAAAAGAGAAVYLTLGLLLLGPPWDLMFQSGAVHVLRYVFAAALVLGMIRSGWRWPLPELFAVWVLAVLAVAGFPPVYGWYRYWGTAFGAAVTAMMIAALFTPGTKDEGGRMKAEGGSVGESEETLTPRQEDGAGSGNYRTENTHA